MRVIVAMESRFLRDAAGAVWSSTVVATFWERYLAVFDEVVVAARVLAVEAAPAGWHRSDRPGVAFHPIPYYVGPAQFLWRWRSVRRSLAPLVERGDAVVLRVPSQIAAMIVPNLRRLGHPYAVEVVGDPHDVFGAGAVRHPLRRFFRWHFARQMGRQCRHAAAAAYVTESVLQARYPAASGAVVGHYSSIELPASDYIDAPRSVTDLAVVRLVFVGSLEQMYKAPDVLLEAVAIAGEKGPPVDLDLVGGGKHRDEIIRLSARLGLGDRVRFHGQLPSGEAVRRLLDAADLFVLPSRVEGLPRAMIEAMARGLPSIGSTVGGIPELLPAQDLVPPGDPVALAAKIREVASDPARLTAMSSRNLATAWAYRSDVLAPRRTAFYRAIEARTATRRPTVTRVIAVPLSLVLFRGQASYLRARGIDLSVVCSPDPALDSYARAEHVEVHGVPMARPISPAKDLVTLVRLSMHLRRTHPTIVHALTPKAALLGMLSATIARTPVRIYEMSGLRYVTATGKQRRVLRSAEWVACRLAHRVLAVSPSLRELAVAERLCPAGKIVVLAGGSNNGVDADGRFDPRKLPTDARTAIRAELGLPAQAVVVGFVGRIVRDKGIVELVEAWAWLRGRFPELRLVLIGPFEPDDPVPDTVEDLLRTDPAVHLTGPVDDVARYYPAFDLLVLPSYREGLGIVLLEAAAMEIPAVATRIPGCVDAVEDGVTGMLVPPCDAAALASAIERYVGDPALRRTHGVAGRRRVLGAFRQKVLWDALSAEYLRLIESRGVEVS